MAAIPLRPRRDELMAIFRNEKIVRQFEQLFDYMTGQLTTDTSAVTQVAATALALSEAARLQVYAPRMPRAPAITAGEGIAIYRDAAGVRLSADLAFLVPAMSAYLPRETPVRPTIQSPDDASAIIAMQVFSRR